MPRSRVRASPGAGLRYFGIIIVVEQIGINYRRLICLIKRLFSDLLISQELQNGVVKCSNLKTT